MSKPVGQSVFISLLIDVLRSLSLPLHLLTINMRVCANYIFLYDHINNNHQGGVNGHANS